MRDTLGDLMANWVRAVGSTGCPIGAQSLSLAWNQPFSLPPTPLMKENILTV